MSRTTFERDGTHLTYRDFGGVGPPMLLLHGLAGYAEEWEPSARLLLNDYRVFALDQRGHGDSERRPADVSRAAFAKDCAAAIERLGLGPVTLVGQSMGANTAMLTAAAYPEQVRSLVMIEGSPAGPHDSDPVTRQEVYEHFRESLSAWPAPFADRAAAEGFFRAKGFDPVAWTDGLESRADGLWPRWEAGTLAACMSDLASRDFWAEWQSIGCPTLVVFGEDGMFASDHGQELLRRLPRASLVTVRGAGHDVHLDAPQDWTRALLESPAR